MITAVPTTLIITSKRYVRRSLYLSVVFRVVGVGCRCLILLMLRVSLFVTSPLLALFVFLAYRLRSREAARKPPPSSALSCARTSSVSERDGCSSETPCCSVVDTRRETFSGASGYVYIDHCLAGASLLFWRAVVWRRWVKGGRRRCYRCRGVVVVAIWFLGVLPSARRPPTESARPVVTLCTCHLLYSYRLPHGVLHVRQLY